MSRPDPAPIALTIAGSDPSGGAGLQADLRVFAAHGLWGAAVPTALTVQGPHGVRGVVVLDADFVEAQVRAVLEELPVLVCKIGMLGSADGVRAVGRALTLRPDLPLVLDPIVAATSGALLLQEGGTAALLGVLLPRVTLLTPNRSEAGVLLGAEIPTGDEVEAARSLQRMGPEWVLLKGGHGNDPQFVRDVAVGPNGVVLVMEAPRVQTVDDHGTGCLFAAAVTSALALGRPMKDALAHARRCLDVALMSPMTFPTGRGAVYLRVVPPLL